MGLRRRGGLGEPDAGWDVVSPTRVAVVRRLEVEVDAGWDVVSLARRALVRVVVARGLGVEIDSGRDYGRPVGRLLSAAIPSGD